MRTDVDVAIIGAGPYGLSLSSHLTASRIEHRIVGIPMQGWTDRMPKGMLLKSEPFASNLSDPTHSFSLGAFYGAQGWHYTDIGAPVPVENFIEYGLAFQNKFVPQVERKRVVSLEQVGDSYLLRLDNGEAFSARRAVVAVGLEYFANLPFPFAEQSAELVSHSSSHTDPKRFSGRDVVVVGGGSSAIDLACLVAEAGGRVVLTTRRAVLDMHSSGGPGPRKIYARVRRPMTGIGPSWRSLFFTEAPHLFRLLPPAMRLRIVKSYLGPAGCWFMKDRLARSVQTVCGARPLSVKPDKGRVRLSLAIDGAVRELRAHHIIAATGYRVDLRKIKFLSPEMRGRLKMLEQTPALSSHFETNIPGLFFVGPASATTFGPVARFVFGAEYTTARLAAYLGQAKPVRPSPEKGYTLVGEPAV